MLIGVWAEHQPRQSSGRNVEATVGYLGIIISRRPATPSHVLSCTVAPQEGTGCSGELMGHLSYVNFRG